MEVFYYRHNAPNELPHDIENERIPFNELTFVLQGELNYTIDNIKVNLKANDCVYLNSGSFRCRQKSDFCEYISFNFYTPISEKLPSFFPDCISEEIRSLFSICDAIKSTMDKWTDKISCALELIVKLLKDKLSRNEENPIILLIKQYVSKKLSEKLTLKEIANHVGYSPNYCLAIFKKETGIPLIDYIIKERIEMAKLLLQERILSLKEIAEAVGFFDYNYFCRTFKKRCGLTPTQYKNRLNHQL